MILVDANILIYSHLEKFPQHAIARAWLDQHLNGPAPVGLPWSSLVAFLRVSTNPRVLDRPESMARAWTAAKEWLACPTTWIPEPTDRHIDVLATMLAVPGVAGKLVPDAHLAALAIEHGLTLCSADTDFARFPGLRWFNPIAPQLAKN